MVTKSGNDCFRCGESCSGSGNDRSFSCNYCSWQEPETRTRPWSTQNVRVDMQWGDDASYKRMRATQSKIANKTVTLKNRMVYDPDRPASHYLFPGEYERFTISQG